MEKEQISIGGQALIEGIMMKCADQYSVAVRTPDGKIDVSIHNVKKSKFGKIPVLRGIVNLFESLSIGYKCIMRSAEISGEGYEEDKLDIWLKEKFGDKSAQVLSFAAGVLGSVLALVLFMILPTFITGILDSFFTLGAWKSLVEGAVKLAIFLLYLWGISRMPEINRLFRYHGAEHKTISCFEAGRPLTVENVRRYTRFHPRCGTSFMFIVLAVSIIIFSFIPWHGTLNRALLKVLFLPLVVGLSYEILRFNGRHTNACTKLLSKPGLWFQRITTAEPDDGMIEVAIASVNALLPETVVDIMQGEEDEQYKTSL